MASQHFSTPERPPTKPTHLKKRIRLVRSIRGQMVFWFVLVSSLPLIFSFFFFFINGLELLQSSLGENFRALATQAAGRMDAMVSWELDWAANVLRNARTIAWVEKANQKYEGLDQTTIQTLLYQQHVEFQIDQGNSLLSNEMSQYLRNMTTYHSQPTAITLTDHQGQLLASSHPVRCYDFSNSSWYRYFKINSAPVGVYLGTSKESGCSAPASEIADLEIVIPIWGERHVSGALRVLMSMDGLFSMVTDTNISAAGWGYRLIDNHKELQCFEQHQGHPFTIGPHILEATGKHNGWLFNPHDNAIFWKEIAGYAELEDVSNVLRQAGGSNWYLVVSQESRETYQAAHNSLLRIGLIGSTAVFLLGLIGLLVARHISKPLSILREGVAAFSGGKGEFTIQVSSSDEIQDLANEFTTMVRRVQQSERRLRAFADAVHHSADAILISDIHNHIEYVNPAFEKLTGFSYDEVLGENPGLLSSHETPPALVHELWQTLKKKEPWRGEMVNQRKNGTRYNADLTIGSILDDDGQLMGYIGVQRDISKVKRRQFLLQEAKQKLEEEVTTRTMELAEAEKLATIGRMAAMISHDMRNPLSAIKMNLQILQNGMAELLEQHEKEHFQIAMEQVFYLEDMLNSLLSYAKPDKLKKEWLDIKKIIQSALVLAERDIRAGGVEAHLVWREHLPFIHADPTQLRQVFTNLIMNGIQAMSDCDHPKLIIEGGHCKLARCQGKHCLQISIIDQGHGIPAELAEHIYEPFVSGHAKGTGLGLAIVRRIVTGHGGRIELHPQQPCGIQATVTLPMQEHNPEKSPAP